MDVTGAGDKAGIGGEASGTDLCGVRVAVVLPTSTGGIGRHVRSLAAGLSARGAHVAVLGPAATRERFGFTGLGVRFDTVEMSTIPRPAADTQAVLRLRTLLRHADVVHAHGLRAGFLAGLALWSRSPGRRGGRTPLVVTWHNALLGGTTTGVMATVTRRVGEGVRRATARLADITIGASPDLVDVARAAGARDARPGPVGAPPLAAARRTAEEVRTEIGAGDRPLVLAVGRLGPQKDYPTLLDAAAEWVRRPRPPVVLIAGEGPLSGELADRVRAQRLPVRLLGHRADVADLLRAADVVVLPSVWEARSLVAQEALRAGRPLVATAVGGTPELVGDAALLVPPRDPRALGDAVTRVVDDPALAARLGEAGRRRAAEFPHEEDTVDRVAALYRELLGGSPRG